MKQSLRSVRRELEDGAETVGAAEIGGAVDVAFVVQRDIGA